MYVWLYFYSTNELKILRRIALRRFDEEVLDFVSVGEDANDGPDSCDVVDLVVPEEKVRRASLRRALEAAVDVLHQQVQLRDFNIKLFIMFVFFITPHCIWYFKFSMFQSKKCKLLWTFTTLTFNLKRTWSLSNWETIPSTWVCLTDIRTRSTRAKVESWNVDNLKANDETLPELKLGIWQQNCFTV